MVTIVHKNFKVIDQVEKLVSTSGDRLGKVLHYIAAVCILLIIVIVTYEVVARYLFDSPTWWSGEISVYLLIITVFFPLAYGLAQESHVKVDLVFNRLSPGHQAKLNLITSILALAFFVLLTWQSGYNSWTAYQRNVTSSGTHPLPLFPVLVAIPLGGFALCLQFLIKIGRHLSFIKNARTRGKQAAIQDRNYDSK